MLANYFQLLKLVLKVYVAAVVVSVVGKVRIVNNTTVVIIATLLYFLN